MVGPQCSPTAHLSSGHSNATLWLTCCLGECYPPLKLQPPWWCAHHHFVPEHCLTPLSPCLIVKSQKHITMCISSCGLTVLRQALHHLIWTSARACSPLLCLFSSVTLLGQPCLICPLALLPFLLLTCPLSQPTSLPLAFPPPHSGPLTHYFCCALPQMLVTKRD